MQIECTREVVRLRNETLKHADEIDFLEGLKAELESPVPPNTNMVIAKLKSRISSLRYGFDEDEPHPPLNHGASDRIPGPSTSQKGHQLIQNGENESTVDKDASIITALEHLAWGRSSGGCYPHRKCACRYSRGWTELSSINSVSFTYSDMPIEAVTLLPPVDEARKLIEFHLTHFAWHHNCLHSTTFLEQCETFWNTGKCDQHLWLALYLSVLSSTVYCVQNSKRFKAALGLNVHTLSPLSLFRAMIDILYSANFLENLSLYSVQAIAISTEIAHNLGFSQLNATLFSAAIRIAECLGLHKIEDSDDSTMNTPEDWYEAVEKETGKRVFCQMVIQDHFAVPFTDSYGKAVLLKTEHKKVHLLRKMKAFFQHITQRVFLPIAMITIL